MAAWCARATWVVPVFLTALVPASGADPRPKPGGLEWGPPAPVMPETEPLPKECSARLGRLLLPVIVKALSPDGRFLATTHPYIPSLDRPAPIHLWSAGSGQHLHVLTGHSIAVLCAAFSPDGTVLATGGQDNTLRFWDTATGKQRGPTRRLGFGQHIYAVFFTPDGKRVLSTSTVVQLWDVATGRELCQFGQPGRSPDEYHTLGALSPDGRAFVTGTIHTLRLWEVATGKLRRQLKAGAEWTNSGLTFSPDGKTVLVSYWPTLQLRKWDLTTGKLRDGGGGPALDRSGRFSPDGRLLAWADNDWREVRREGTVVVVETATGKERRRIRTPSDISSYRFAADGKTLAVGGRDGSLRFWDVTTGKLLRTSLEPRRSVFALRCSTPRDFLSVTADGALHEWDATAARERRQGRLPLPAGDFLLTTSARGNSLATVRQDGTLRLWDLTDGKERWKATAALTVRPPPADPAPPPVKPWITMEVEELLKPVPDVAVALSADGRFVAGVTDEGTRATVWDATGKKSRTLRGKAVSGLALSADGRELVLGVSEEKAPVVCVLDLVTGRETDRAALPAPAPTGDHVSRTSTIPLLCLAPNGKTAAVAERVARRYYGRKLRFTAVSWQIHLWERIGKKALITVSSEASPVLTFSPDGKLLAYAYRDRVAVYDIARRKTYKPKGGHLAAVTALAFSPDGTTLASGSKDTTILLWDVAKITR